MSTASRAAQDHRLSEHDLRHLARHASALLPKGRLVEQDIDLNKFLTTFQSVLDACHSTGDAPYRVAAWNTLCSLLDQTASAESNYVRDLLWASRLWLNSLNLFATRSKDARPKSIKQLLVSLSNALRKAQSSGAFDLCRQEAIAKLLQTILELKTDWDVRSCLTLLSHFLSRDNVGLSEVYIQLKMVMNVSSVDQQYFLELCIKAIPRADCASQAAHLISVVLNKRGEEANGEFAWVAPLHRVLQQSPDLVEVYRVYLLPILFRQYKSGFATLLRRFGFDTTLGTAANTFAKFERSDQTIVAAILRAGNEANVVGVHDDAHANLGPYTVQLSLSLLRQMIRHSERNTRLAGLSLLIDVHSITRPFTPAALDLLAHSFTFLHADVDAGSRSELFAMVQRLYDRIRAVAAVLARQVEQPDHDRAVKELLQSHRAFIIRHRSFLAWELRPGTSYQRHISALRCLSILLKCGLDETIPTNVLTKSSQILSKWPFSLLVVDKALEELLIDLLTDPFDDVRQAAASVLSMHLHSSSSNNSTRQALHTALVTAEKAMLVTGRADHADAVAHLNALTFEAAETKNLRSTIIFRLLEQIQSMLEAAQDDLATAVSRYPLHGLLTSLRYILAKTPPELLTERIFHPLCLVLDEIWQVVKSTLCDDAPEGYVPDDLADDYPLIDTKDILSYCWRALKEASLLLGLTLQLLSREEAILQAQWSFGLIELTFTQLAELRHRGAFSTVAQTWTTCCLFANKVPELPDLSDLCDRVMQLIQRATINTRRSAGLPSLLCGILAADSTEQMLPRAVQTLSGLSRQPVRINVDDESSLPQVHALNCIKDILKNTKLAAQSERVAAPAFRLAADSMQSSTWAIRNCGLMLFRAVIDRLLGTNDSYIEDTAIRNVMDFGHYPELLDIVLGLINDTIYAVSTDMNPRYDGIFPALQMLQHAKLPESRLQAVHTACLSLTKSPPWLVRDKAARTFTSIATPSVVLASVQTLIQDKLEDNNQIHGVLLVLRHLLRTMRSDTQSAAENIRHSTDVKSIRFLVDSIASKTICSPVSELCIDLRTQTDTLLTTSKQIPRTVEGHVDPALSTPKSQEPFSMDVSSACRQFFNSEEADRWLEARSIFLEQQATSNLVDPAITEAIADLVLAYSTVYDTTSLFSTDAVVRALRKSRYSLGLILRSTAHNHHAQNLCLLVYDLLNDDDEEIRSMGAITACKILNLDQRGNATRELEPLNAAQALLGYMVTTWSKDSNFASTILLHAFKLTPVENHFEVVLQSAIKQDSALFAEEKQNLYIDDALEAKTWSRAAMRMTPSVFRLNDLTALVKFVDTGLQILVGQTSEDKAGEDLRWSRSPDGFVLGLQLIYATELLLHLIKQGIRLSVKPSELRGRLVTILSQGRKRGLHCLWLRELERVSTIALASNARSVGSLLDLVVRRLDGEIS